MLLRSISHLIRPTTFQSEANLMIKIPGGENLMWIIREQIDIVAHQCHYAPRSRGYDLSLAS